MDILESILAFYVLPLLISIVMQYLEKDVRTFGDFIKPFWLMVTPVVNLACLITIFIMVVCDRLKLEIYWKKLMSIKIKSLIIVSSSFLFFSCGNAEQRIREHSYTNKWFTVDSLRFQVYKTKSGREYIIILNERETKFIRKYI